MRAQEKQWLVAVFRWEHCLLLILGSIVCSDSATARASFNDTRCTGGLVCPSYPLLYTCTITGSSFAIMSVDLPGGVRVSVKDNGSLRGDSTLPEGITVSDSAANHVTGTGVNYLLQLAIERADLLGGQSVTCNTRSASPSDQDHCPVADNPPGSPLNLHQISSANTESSVVVQWEAPEETGASGVYISEYTVTVDGNSTESVTDDGRDVFTHTISGLEYNTSYDVEVTAINSCDIRSQPATTRATTRPKIRAPPQPTLLSPVLTCDTLQPETGRTVIFTWEYGEREEGAVYPGEEMVKVELSGDTVCYSVTTTDTSCTTVITRDGNYTVSLALNNDEGSVSAVREFDSRPLKVEEREGPAVAVTLNPLCGGSVPYTVELSFGVREEDSGEECLPQQNISATILPGASLVLPVTDTHQEHCFSTLTLNSSANMRRPTVNSDTTVSSTSSGVEGNFPLDVVLVTLSCFLSVLVALVVGVVLGWCVGRRVRRVRREREISELSDRRMSEKELVKQECIYDEPCLTGTAISVAPNQAYGHINIRSNQTN